MLSEWLLAVALSAGQVSVPACPTTPVPAAIAGLRASADVRRLAAAVAWVEDRWRTGGVSKAGAIGLMQVMPETGRWLQMVCAAGAAPELGLFDPRWNAQLGTCFLQLLYAQLGDWTAALVWYNGGKRQFDRLVAGKRLAPETRTYVVRVWWVRAACPLALPP